MNPDIFIQGFLARLVPIYHERVLGALRHFNFEAYPQNAALAAVGALLALVIWYGVGVWLRRMPERVSTEEQRARIEAMRSTAREWLPWLLILSPTPLGGVVVMASAFFRLRPIMVMA
jgi:membrane protein YqaA with SNARE-associated domain